MIGLGRVMWPCSSQQDVRERLMGENVSEEDLLVLIKKHKGERECLPSNIGVKKKKGWLKLLQSSWNQKYMPGEKERKKCMPGDVLRKRMVRGRGTRLITSGASLPQDFLCMRWQIILLFRTFWILSFCILQVLPSDTEVSAGWTWKGGKHEFNFRLLSQAGVSTSSKLP